MGKHGDSNITIVRLLRTGVMLVRIMHICIFMTLYLTILLYSIVLVICLMSSLCIVSRVLGNHVYATIISLLQVCTYVMK